MFELAPFERCPSCGSSNSFGVLSIRAQSFHRRCKLCRFTLDFDLPKPSKKVVYLDQNAISEIYKTRAGTRSSNRPHKHAWVKIDEKVSRAVLLHVLAAPTSSIHSQESELLDFGAKLSITHRMMGDVKFIAPHKVEALQELSVFRSVMSGQPLSDDLSNVEVVLEGDLNSWLDKIHIDVEWQSSPLAEMYRHKKKQSANAFKGLWQKWKAEKRTYQQIVTSEFASTVEGHISKLRSNDPALCNHFLDLCEIATQAGTSDEEAPKRVLKFWQSEDMRLVPAHDIACHFFAALGRRAVNGQKCVDASIFNDVSAIGSYAPYVDAMFLDKECATLLSEIAGHVSFKAKIFSVKNIDDFVSYLDQIVEDGDPDVKAKASELYGLKN